MPGQTLSRFRMRLIVNGLQVFERDMSVLLGSREAGMAEEFLDGAEVGSVG